jgi:hypothetical protein
MTPTLRQSDPFVLVRAVRRGVVARLAARLLACLLLTAALPAVARPAAETLPFRLEIAPAEATIGDRISVRLLPTDPQFDPGRIQAVAFDGESADWEVTGRWCRDWQEQEKDKSGPWGATIRPFAVGALPLPPTVVAYKDDGGELREVRLASATLAVNSVRAPGADTLELTPLRDLAEIPPDWGRLVWTAAGFLLASLAAAALMWAARRRRDEPLPAEPPLPPGLWALRELERRSRLPVCRTGPAKTIYSMVSEVLRLYLQRRWGVDAIDMTTRECLDALAARDVDAKVLKWIRQFLDECDLVKFTDREFDRPRWITIWNDAKLIVQHTTPPGELGQSSAPRPAPETPVPAIAESAR